MTLPSPFAAASDLAGAVKSRETSSVELVEMYRARIATHNPALNAIIYTDWDAALATARECDAALARGEAIGPLHGVPVTIKEAFEVKGTPATWGMPELRNNIASRDAAAVARLRAAGAVIMGKTNVPRLLADHQTFNAVYGRTNNPWDLATGPGGSSGGAAVALAAGLTGLELGSDIGGSIRNPAHHCGVYGHKPTFGICSTRGHDLPGDLVPLDMGVVGPMGRSARDLDLGLSVLSGADGAESAGWQLTLPTASTRPLSELRVGVMLDDAAAPVDEAVKMEIDKLADFLAARGAKVTRQARPVRDTATAFSIYTRLLRSATLLHVSDVDVQASITEAAGLERDARGYAVDSAFGRALSHRDWLRLNEQRHQIKLEWDAFFNTHDVLLCPAACRAAAPQDETSVRHERTIEINGEQHLATNDLFWAGLVGMAHLPSTAAPIGSTANGMPVGVQIVGKWYQDRSTIALARLLEQNYRAFVAPPAYAAPRFGDHVEGQAQSRPPPHHGR